MSRASRRDWLVAGLAVLRDRGHHAITVDRLCDAIDKTKGSFYHHFVDLDAYLAALLQLWEAELTEQPIEVSRAEPDNQRRTARLGEVVSKLDHRLDRAVRAWALRDDRARVAMARVDARRIDFLAELHQSEGEFARLRAELDYAAFVGIQHVDALSSTPSRAARLDRELQRALDALGRANRRRS